MKKEKYKRNKKKTNRKKIKKDYKVNKIVLIIISLLVLLLVFILIVKLNKPKNKTNESLFIETVENNDELITDIGKRSYDYELELANIADKKIGDIVRYGNYYINNNSEKENVEWIILDKNEISKEVILLSKYVLERKKFNDLYEPILWQNSDIRKWLSKDFYNALFSEQEKTYILNGEIKNDNYLNYNTIKGSSTYDRIYLPSFDDVKNYMGDDILSANGTKYFKEIGGYVDKNGKADWWLRTNGDIQYDIMYILAKGEINLNGDYSITDDIGVRPMIKIKYK